MAPLPNVALQSAGKCSVYRCAGQIGAPITVKFGVQKTGLLCRLCVCSRTPNWWAQWIWRPIKFKIQKAVDFPFFLATSVYALIYLCTDTDEIWPWVRGTEFQKCWIMERFYLHGMHDLLHDSSIGIFYRMGQKQVQYVWRLTSFAYIFKMPEPISTIFGRLQRRYILNTSVDSIFIKFIIQNGATWRNLITRICCKRMIRGVQHGPHMHSRTSLQDKLLKKIGLSPRGIILH